MTAVRAPVVVPCHAQVRAHAARLRRVFGGRSRTSERPDRAPSTCSRVRDPGNRAQRHDRERNGPLPRRIAEQLEQPATGREFRELPAGVAGRAVLPGLPLEEWQRVRGRHRPRAARGLRRAPSGAATCTLRRRHRFTIASSCDLLDPEDGSVRRTGRRPRCARPRHRRALGLFHVSPAIVPPSDSFNEEKRSLTAARTTAAKSLLRQGKNPSRDLPYPALFRTVQIRVEKCKFVGQTSALAGRMAPFEGGSEGHVPGEFRTVARREGSDDDPDASSRRALQAM